MNETNILRIPVDVAVSVTATSGRSSNNLRKYQSLPVSADLQAAPDSLDLHTG
jgi:hypothetical protein